MKESAVEGAKMISSSLRDKALKILLKQTLRVESTAEAILKDVKGTSCASEYQDPEATMEEDIPAEARVVVEASNVSETTTICMVSDPILVYVSNSSIP